MGERSERRGIEGVLVGWGLGCLEGAFMGGWLGRAERAEGR